MAIYFTLTINCLIACSFAAARVVLALYALELGADPATVGLLAATFSALPLVSALPAGKFADRYGSRWLLLAVSAVAAIGMLMPYLARGLPAMFAAAVLIGLAAGTCMVSAQNLIGVLSNTDNRTRNFSNLGLTFSVATSIGQIGAGFAIDYAGHATTCFYVSLLTLIPVALLALWGGMLPGGNRRENQADQGIRGLLADSAMRKALTISGLQAIGQDIYQFYMPIYTHALGWAASTIGVVLAMTSAAAIAVRLFLPKLVKAMGQQRLLAYAFYTSAVSFAFIPFFHSAVMLGLISFVFGLGIGCQGPIITMIAFMNAPKGRSGEAMGIRVTVTYLSRIVGPIVFGTIGSAFGLLPVFLLNAMMMGAGGYISTSSKSGEPPSH